MFSEKMAQIEGTDYKMEGAMIECDNREDVLGRLHSGNGVSRFVGQDIDLDNYDFDTILMASKLMRVADAIIDGRALEFEQVFCPMCGGELEQVFSRDDNHSGLCDGCYSQNK